MNGVGTLLKTVMSSAVNPDPLSCRKNAITDNIGEITVDTSCPSDTGLWETGIRRSKKENWIIVEQYENKKTAKIGHLAWVEKIKADKNMELRDIFLDDYEDLNDSDDNDY